MTATTNEQGGSHPQAVQYYTAYVPLIPTHNKDTIIAKVEGIEGYSSSAVSQTQGQQEYLTISFLTAEARDEAVRALDLQQICPNSLPLRAIPFHQRNQYIPVYYGELPDGMSTIEFKAMFAEDPNFISASITHTAGGALAGIAIFHDEISAQRAVDNSPFPNTCQFQPSPSIYFCNGFYQKENWLTLVEYDLPAGTKDFEWGRKLHEPSYIAMTEVNGTCIGYAQFSSYSNILESIKNVKNRYEVLDANLYCRMTALLKTTPMEWAGRCFFAKTRYSLSNRELREEAENIDHAVFTMVYLAPNKGFVARQGLVLFQNAFVGMSLDFPNGPITHIEQYRSETSAVPLKQSRIHHPSADQKFNCPRDLLLEYVNLNFPGDEERVRNIVKKLSIREVSTIICSVEAITNWVISLKGQ